MEKEKKIVKGDFILRDKRLSFNERWLRKAEKITGKSRYYMVHSDELYLESVQIIRSSDTIKPNRIVNKLRDYKKSQGN